MQRRIVIVGAGASGLMAAARAAGCGAKVTVLEKESSPGKKLLTTGNGRCNLTNLHLDPGNYRGYFPEFAARVLEKYSVQKTLDYFHSIGLMTTDRDGWVYPVSMQASSVLRVLLGECERLGVKIKNNEEVLEIEKKSTGLWLVKTEGWDYEADAVILCGGTTASVPVSFGGSCLLMANHQGHVIVPFEPALCPLRSKKVEKWSGVRVNAEAALFIEGAEICRETGEVQMTDYGYSGIPIFQLSRFAVCACDIGKHTELVFDFLPGVSEEDLKSWVQAQQEKYPSKSISSILCGILPEKLAQVIGKKEDPFKAAKAYKSEILGMPSLQYAQVASGGVDTPLIDPETMESRKQPGLYFAGELIDIDGPCGGYNLQWAWSSGAAAGISAAEANKKAAEAMTVTGSAVPGGQI